MNNNKTKHLPYQREESLVSQNYKKNIYQLTISIQDKQNQISSAKSIPLFSLLTLRGRKRCGKYSPQTLHNIAMRRWRFRLFGVTCSVPSCSLLADRTTPTWRSFVVPFTPFSLPSAPWSTPSTLFFFLLWRFGPGFGPGFRQGFGPGFRPGFGPGFWSRFRPRQCLFWSFLLFLTMGMTILATWTPRPTSPAVRTSGMTFFATFLVMWWSRTMVRAAMLWTSRSTPPRRSWAAMSRPWTWMVSIIWTTSTSMTITRSWPPSFSRPRPPLSRFGPPIPGRSAITGLSTWFVTLAARPRTWAATRFTFTYILFLACLLSVCRKMYVIDKWN